MQLLEEAEKSSTVGSIETQTMCYPRKICVPSPEQLPKAGAGASTGSEHLGADLCRAPQETARQLSWTNPQLSSAATGKSQKLL